MRVEEGAFDTLHRLEMQVWPHEYAEFKMSQYGKSSPVRTLTLASFRVLKQDFMGHFKIFKRIWHTGTHSGNAFGAVFFFCYA